MAAVWLLLRTGWRRHPWQQVALAGLIALGGAMVLATLAGARRTETADDRFVEWSRLPDVFLSVDEVGHPRLSDQQIAAVRSLPDVDGSALLAFVGIQPAAFYVYQPTAAVISGGWGTTVARSRYVAGRAPVAADEMSVSEQRAEVLGLRLGDTISMTSFSPEQVQRLGALGPDESPAGPRLRLRLVGIERNPGTLGTDRDIASITTLSRAFVETYAGRVGIFNRVVAVHLRSPGRYRAFMDSVHELPGLAGVEGEELTMGGSVGATLDFVGRGLRLLSAVLAVATLAAVSLVTARVVSADAADDHRRLSAIGLTRSGRWAAQVLRPAPAIVVGAVVAIAGAVALSPLFPFGLGGRAEPDPGVRFDRPALALGALVMLLAFAAITAALAWTAVTSTRFLSGGRRRSPLPTTSLPLPLGLGTRFAVDRGPAGRPSRAAAIGVALGSAGLVGALVFSSSAAWLKANPAAWGQTWDYGIPASPPQVTSLVGDAPFEAVTEVKVYTIEINRSPVKVRTYTAIKGPPMDPVANGRPPGVGEVVLGRATMEALAVGVGDTVVLSGPRGTAEVEVVGQGMFASINDVPVIAEGAAVDDRTRSRVTDGDRTTEDTSTLVRFAPGADRRAVRGRIAAALEDQGYAPSDLQRILAGNRPDEFDRLDEIRPIPWLVAICLGSLAVAATSALLVTAVQRRRRDLAVLRAEGLERRRVRQAVAAQATTVSILGLVVGVPLGAVFGRVLWRSVADDLGVVVHIATPVWWLVASVVVVVAVDLAISAIPAGRAARVSVAAELRAE